MHPAIPANLEPDGGAKDVKPKVAGTDPPTWGVAPGRILPKSAAPAVTSLLKAAAGLPSKKNRGNMAVGGGACPRADRPDLRTKFGRSMRLTYIANLKTKPLR